MPIKCLLLALMLFQYPYPYPGTVPRTQGSAPGRDPANTGAVATFTGTFKSADKKTLFIDLEDGNTLHMYITGATKFIRDDRPAKLSDFHSGENVIVDASRDTRLNLLAVRVTAAPPKPEKKSEQ